MSGGGYKYIPREIETGTGIGNDTSKTSFEIVKTPSAVHYEKYGVKGQAVHKPKSGGWRTSSSISGGDSRITADSLMTFSTQGGDSSVVLKSNKHSVFSKGNLLSRPSSSGSYQNKCESSSAFR